ncbi:MAG: hypothetical protein AAB225_23810, partial [Acidobacteriota bacterium]
MERKFGREALKYRALAAEAFRADRYDVAEQHLRQALDHCRPPGRREIQKELAIVVTAAAMLSAPPGGATSAADRKGLHLPPPPSSRELFRCSAFYPEKVRAADVGKIVACVHLESVAGKVVREAAQRLDLPSGIAMKAASEIPLERVSREMVIDVTPDVPGLVFDTLRASLVLWQDAQSVEFRFKAGAGAIGTACRGWVHFWLEGVILADVPVTIFVATEEAPEIFREALATANARPYRLVFPSYSHQDVEIVERLETYAASFGD